jgi:hypothetical protein
METLHSFKISGTTRPLMQHHIPEDLNPQHQKSRYSLQIDCMSFIHVQDPVPVMEYNMSMETDCCVEEEVVSFSAEQRLLLDQQLRKHVQLTMQHFLQTYSHPQLSHCAADCRGIIVSCSEFQFNCFVNRELN